MHLFWETEIHTSRWSLTTNSPGLHSCISDVFDAPPCGVVDNFEIFQQAFRHIVVNIQVPLINWQLKSIRPYPEPFKVEPRFGPMNEDSSLSGLSRIWVGAFDFPSMIFWGLGVWCNAVANAWRSWGTTGVSIHSAWQLELVMDRVSPVFLCFVPIGYIAFKARKYI